MMAGMLLLGACGTDSPAAADGARVEVPLTAIHVVAEPEALARVVDLQPAGNGQVWVLNSVEPYFVVVDPDGQIQRTFGQQGGGPAEFGAPVGLVRGPSGEIWTYDVTRHALRRISGEKPLDLKLPPDSLPPGRIVSFQDSGLRPARPWMESVGAGFLMGRAKPSASGWSAAGLWHSDILSVRPDSPGVTLQVRTAVSTLLGDPASRYPGATAFLPYPLWAVCADGTLGLYDPLRNALRRFEANGQEIGARALPEERRVPMSFDDMFRMIYRQIAEETSAAERPDSAKMRSVLEGQFRRTQGTYADVLPEYADLRCVGDDVYWIQPFDVASGHFGHGPQWLRIAADGSRTTVVFPDAFTPFRFDGARIWGAEADSLGAASVAWVEVGG